MTGSAEVFFATCIRNEAPEGQLELGVNGDSVSIERSYSCGSNDYKSLMRLLRKISQKSCLACACFSGEENVLAGAVYKSSP